MKSTTVSFEFNNKSKKYSCDMYSLSINGKECKELFRRYEEETLHLHESHFMELQAVAINDFPFDEKIYFDASLKVLGGRLANFEFEKIDETNIGVEFWYYLTYSTEKWVLNPFRLIILMEEASKDKSLNVDRSDANDDGEVPRLIYNLEVRTGTTFGEVYQKAKEIITEVYEKAMKQLIAEAKDVLKL